MAGIPGAPVLPPRAPQLAYAADPGSITEWLLLDSASDEDADIALQIEAISNRMAALPAVGTADHATETSKLKDEVLVSDDLSCFLTITTLDALPPFVSVVLGLCRYSGGLGAISQFQGRVLGFIGEVIGDQLPPMVQVGPDAVDLSNILLPEARYVPTAAEVRAYYANPAIARTSLMPGQANGAQAALARLAYLPKAWVPYFLDRKTPWDAYDTMSLLMEGLSSDAQRAQAEPLLEWTAAACVRLGGNGVDRRTSALNSEWETPPVPDRKVLRWATTRLAPFRSPTLIAAPAQIGAGGGPANPPMMATAAVDSKNFSELEHLKIRSASGLTVAQYEQAVFVPELFTMMLTEGRTTTNVTEILRRVLTPDEQDDHPVSIFVARDMASDLKALNFGFGGDTSYATCHRGISPFAVAAVSQESASYQRRMQERTRRSTHLSLEDAASLESSPGACPTSYDGLIRLMTTYMTFLEKVVGARCPHHTEVRAIRKILLQKVATYENMSPEKVAEVLWSIFVDARNYFSELAQGDVLPTSSLTFARHWLKSGSIKTTEGCPVHRLLGINIGHTPVTQHESPSNSPLFGQAKLPSSAGPRLNPSPVAILIAATKPILAKHPRVSVKSIMDASDPPVTYKTVKVGAPGACLDFHILGRCINPMCAFTHAATPHVPDTRARQIAAILTTNAALLK
jgi:hypothetical protein